MIARLTGRLDSTGENWAVIDVAGVGYLTFCSSRTLSRLPGEGEPVSLGIHTHVREHSIDLYGFFEAAERDCFRLLITVQGVGTRVALAILSSFGPSDLSAAIAAQDRKTLTRAAGVGPKMAGRIVAELKDKTGGFGDQEFDAPGDGGTVLEEAVSALVNLGYSRGEAYSVAYAQMHVMGEDAPLEAVIRAGLKELSS